ncbi:MAG: Flp family type IVb pilin [Panacagrimonas sp.]
MLNEMFFRAYAAAVSLNRKQEGASAVEYGLILGLIAVVIVGILITIGGDLESIFSEASSELKGAVPAGG